MGDSKRAFFITDIILLIVFLGLILVIFRFSGIRFLLELLAVVILLFVAFIASILILNNIKIHNKILCPAKRLN